MKEIQYLTLSILERGEKKKTKFNEVNFPDPKI